VSFVFLAFLLSSCSGGERVDPVAEKQDEVVEVPAPSVEVEPREPVYVYEDKPEVAVPERIILTLHADPVLLPVGYVRLAGMVGGARPLALLDIAGKGRGAGIGDLVAGYRVAGIFGERIVLEREEK
jgi:hypothetical protein